ncbi:MAG: ion transporter [Planctomycetota bacterium]|nr:ion transporter [Planctomycetota bacterium]
MQEAQKPAAWRSRLHRIIFESDSPSGKGFDVALIVAIFVSIVVVMLESVKSLSDSHATLLRLAEWGFTALFTIEYVLRLLCVSKPLRYARSFFGIVDLLAILPTYISLLVPGTQALLVIRTLRILRIFRVLKLVKHVRAAENLMQALRGSRRKIEVFLYAVFSLVVIFGSMMYLIEGPENGFTSIPKGIYWAVVTMTTVGYGDLSPQSPLGQTVASVIMILGYGIIAVPTGIVSAEMALLKPVSKPGAVSGQACPACGGGAHALDAAFCRLCGSKM